MESAVLRTLLLTLSGFVHFQISGLSSLMSRHPLYAIKQSKLKAHAACFWFSVANWPMKISPFQVGCTSRPCGFIAKSVHGMSVLSLQKLSVTCTTGLFSLNIFDVRPVITVARRSRNTETITSISARLASRGTDRSRLLNTNLNWQRLRSRVVSARYLWYFFANERAAAVGSEALSKLCVSAISSVARCTT